MSESITESYFTKYGILGPNSVSGAAKVLLKIQPDLDSVTYKTPASYISDVWKQVQKSKMSTSMNGVAFELLLACVFVQENLHPFYMSAEVQFVPNARFDLLFYTEEIGPVVISAKTSLRERYKQADLESLALRAVYRRSKTILVTLDSHEAKGVQEKIVSGDVTSLNACITATSKEFNDLIDELHTYKMIQAPTLPIVRSGRLIS
jgi:hypothetical protein